MPKLIGKVLEAKIKQLKQMVSAKFKKLATKRNQIESLMVAYDNLDTILKMYNSIIELLGEFRKL